MVVKFEGKIYDTGVVTRGDSVVYLNEEYAELYCTKISKLTNEAAILSYDESGTAYIEYFPSEKKLLEQYDFGQLEEKTESALDYNTRGGVINMMKPDNKYPVIAVAELYDDKNFEDTELIVYATTGWGNAIYRLKDLGFNDKTSSIRVFNKMHPQTVYSMGYVLSGEPSGELHWNDHSGSDLRPVLKGYEDTNYSGSVLYCIASPTGSPVDHIDNDLKRIGWNDKISAVAWSIIHDFSVFIGKDGKAPEIPEHPDC